jgi:hypothetical protein
MTFVTVLLRKVAMRFMAVWLQGVSLSVLWLLGLWLYCCEDLLLGLWLYCCEELHGPYCGEELHVWSKLKVNTSFIRGHLFRSSQPRFEETLGFGPGCGSDGKKNWKIKQDSQVVKQSCCAVRN